jgi:hypothetical protein
VTSTPSRHLNGQRGLLTCRRRVKGLRRNGFVRFVKAEAAKATVGVRPTRVKSRGAMSEGLG